MPGAFEFGLMFGAVYAIALAPVFLLALAIPYAVLRLERGREGDPQLGLKVALQFFFSLAVMLAVVGVTAIVVDYLARDAEANDVAAPGAGGRLGPGAGFGGGFGRPNGAGPFGKPDEKEEEFMNSTQRFGLALILSGAILIGIVHVLILMATTEANWVRVRRVFAGWRFAIDGLVASAAITMLCVVLLAKERPDRAMQTLVGVLFVWSAAAAIDAFLLRAYATGPRRRASERIDLPDRLEIDSVDMQDPETTPDDGPDQSATA